MGEMPLDIEAFYREHYRMVFGYLLSLCGNKMCIRDRYTAFGAEKCDPRPALAPSQCISDLPETQP